MLQIDIKRALQQAMKERGYKVPAISKILDIPADRIYKWYQQGTNPKEEDAVKVWNWINGESVNRGTISAVEEQQESYLSKRLEIKNGSKHPIPVYGLKILFIHYLHNPRLRLSGGVTKTNCL